MKVEPEVELTNNPNQFLLSILYQSVTVGISGTVSERGLPDLLLQNWIVMKILEAYFSLEIKLELHIHRRI